MLVLILIILLPGIAAPLEQYALNGFKSQLIEFINMEKYQGNFHYSGAIIEFIDSTPSHRNARYLIISQNGENFIATVQKLIPFRKRSVRIEPLNERNCDEIKRLILMY